MRTAGSGSCCRRPRRWWRESSGRRRRSRATSCAAAASRRSASGTASALATAGPRPEVITELVQCVSTSSRVATRSRHSWAVTGQHQRAALGQQPDHPLRLQPEQRLADRGPGHTGLPGDLRPRRAGRCRRTGGSECPRGHVRRRGRPRKVGRCIHDVSMMAARQASSWARAYTRVEWRTHARGSVLSELGFPADTCRGVSAQRAGAGAAAGQLSGRGPSRSASTASSGSPWWVKPGGADVPAAAQRGGSGGNVDRAPGAQRHLPAVTVGLLEHRGDIRLLRGSHDVDDGVEFFLAQSVPGLVIDDE